MRHPLIPIAAVLLMSAGCGRNANQEPVAANPEVTPAPHRPSPQPTVAAVPTPRPVAPPREYLYQEAARFQKEVEAFGGTAHVVGSDTPGRGTAADLSVLVKLTPKAPNQAGLSEVLKRLDTLNLPFDLSLTDVPDVTLDSIREAFKLNNIRGLDAPAVAALPALRYSALDRIERLTLAGQLPGDDLSFLKRTPNLVAFSATGDSLTRFGVAPVAALTRLRRLALGGNFLTDADLGFIGSLGELRSVRLAGSQLTVGNFRHTATLPALTEMFVDPGKKNPEHVNQDQTRRWEQGKLDLRYINFANEPLGPLAGLVSLRGITLVNCENVRAAEAKVMGSWPNLESISFVNASITPGEFSEFGKSAKLKEVTLMFGGDGHLETLEKLPDLQVVFMGGQITDAGLARLKNSTKLRELTLAIGYSVGDTGVAHLAGLKELTRLYLNVGYGATKGKITDASVDTIAGFKRLQALRLVGASITDAAVNKLASLPDLTDLDINNTLITPNGLSVFLKHPKLKHIYFQNNHVYLRN